MTKRKRTRPSMRVLPVKRPRGLTRNQAKSVRRIARKTALGLSETINAVTVVENKQLFHNKTDYVGKLLATEQGLKDDNSSTASPDAVRKGDEIILKNNPSAHRTTPPFAVKNPILTARFLAVLWIILCQCT